MNRPIMTTLFILAAATLAGCAPRFDAERAGQSFFDAGRRQILAGVEHAKATPAQTEQAHAIIERHGATVPGEITAMLRSHRELLRAVTSGKDSAALLALDESFRARHRDAVQGLGRMHDELRAALGDPLWGAVQAELQEQSVRHFPD